jgi:hypothetical protein
MPPLVLGGIMAEKNFLSWVGFKGEEEKSSVTQQPLERIRELESQLADLRSRRDITALSKEEFEILATETAMSIIRTAQQRESKANSIAERIVNESKKSAASAVDAAQAKANSLLSAAESRGRKYIEAAEGDAAAIVEDAEREGNELLASRKREASNVLSNAKREAERLVQGAAGEITAYRSWLSQVISEAERLYRIQTQSLDAAQNAIQQSRERLDSAYRRLSDFEKQVSDVVGSDGKLSSTAKVTAGAVTENSTTKKKTAKSAKAAPKRRR